MSDPVSWGLLSKVNSNVKKTKNAVENINLDSINDALDSMSDSLKDSMNEFSASVGEQVGEMSESVKSVGGGPLPFAFDRDKFSLESVEEGIKVTYEPTILIATQDRDANTWGSIEPYGVMIRYSDKGFPRTPQDGLLAVDDTDIVNGAAQAIGTQRLYGKEKTATVVGLTNNTLYYFSAFPYSYAGIYNVNRGFVDNTDDGSNSQRKTCTWTGTRGTLTVDVSANIVVFPIGEITVTLTPTAGGEAVTQTRTGVGQVTFSNLEGGEYTLSVSDITGYTHSSKSVTAIAGQLVTESIQYTLKTGLANYSWAEVVSVADAGYASQVFSVGETKDLTVLSETLTMKIYGFNHDDLADGSGKAPITWGMAHLMANTRQMNTSNTNAGSFVGTAMYAYLRDTILPNLPEEIRSHIKTVKKKTSAGNQSSSVQTDSVKIFLFSVNEVAGTQSGTWVSNNEGSQYPVFSNDASRVKKLANGSGAAQWWWLRSPDLNISRSFCGVDSDGAVYDYYDASSSDGVCFGFCL